MSRTTSRTPSTPSTALCRDKAALLVVMLRLAGFDAFPTLIDTGAKKDPEVAQPYFDHAIVAVREPDGTYMLMDPTDENTTKLLPAYLDDKSYLVATPEGDPLRTSPVDPAESNLMRIETRGRINATGGCRPRRCCASKVSTTTPTAAGSPRSSRRTGAAFSKWSRNGPCPARA